MSSIKTDSIQTGFWTDWTQGGWKGCLLTLSHVRGGFLQAFTAIFTTFVFTQLWIIVTITIHHLRSTNHTEDGLTHQRQVIIRNSGAPVATVNFLKQMWYWNRKAKYAKMRSLGWIIFAGGFTIVSGLGGIFSAYAWSKTSSNRLIRPSNCGYSFYLDKSGLINGSAFTVSRAYDSITAANHARVCYDSKTANFDQCKRYIKAALRWNGTENSSCPFESGICSNGDQAAFTLLTEGIDSLADLGIDSHPSDRLILQKKMTCSSIRESKNYHQNNTLVYYDFGKIRGGSLLGNSTFVYNRLAEAALVPYSMSSTYAYAGFPSTWTPTPAMNRTDADVTIVFVSANDVVYSYTNQDPVFSATKVWGSGYLADYDVSTLACAEQYLICNPASHVAEKVGAGCSPWMGAFQVMQQLAYLNSTSSQVNAGTISSLVPVWNQSDAQLTRGQIAILGRIAFVLPQTSLYNAIASRGSSALRLQDTVADLIQTEALPDNYWTSEVGWWFDACLARLQEGIMAFATGPSDPAATYHTTLLGDKETTELCQKQLTRTVGDETINFSVPGLSIIYGIGFIIIVMSLSSEWVIRKCLTKFWPSKAFKSTIWDQNEVKHLQAAAFNATEGFTEHIADSEVEGDNLPWTLDGFPRTTPNKRLLHFSIVPHPSPPDLA